MKKIKLVVITLLLLAAAIAGLLFLHGSLSTSNEVARPQKTYVALGDSMAAGSGLDEASDSSACGRTRQAYPNEVASSLNMQLTHLACTGASSQIGVLNVQDVNGLATTQIEQLFSLKKPNLITLTIGANDIDWTSTIGKCYLATCGEASDIDKISDGIARVGTNITAILDRIQNNYQPSRPTVIVTGYYQVFPEGDGSCTSLVGVDTDERSWWRSEEQQLNSAINASVGRYSFARFAPVSFSGHELCSDDSWVQGFRGKTPFHPTENGQKAIAKSIINVYKK